MSPRLIAAVLPWVGACGPAAPEPAAHTCLDLADGAFIDLTPPSQVYGIGLAYAGHLRETGQAKTERPPVFAKRWTPRSDTVAIPSVAALERSLEATEPGLAQAVRDRGIALHPLVDYEVELGLVLLDNLRPGEVPDLAFFVANDLSERGQAVLGEGQPNRYRYWGDSKSHPGFLPTTDRAWRPTTPVRDGLPCVTLEARVNGELRQSATPADLVYTVSELLAAVEATSGKPLLAGTWILTGTPSGVALATPAWKVAMADLVGLDRFSRLDVVLGRQADFLSPGDEVDVEAEGLGKVSTTLQ